MIYYQVHNINKDIEMITHGNFGNKILEIKNTLSKVKNSMERFKSTHSFQNKESANLKIDQQVLCNLKDINGREDK